MRVRAISPVAATAALLAAWWGTSAAWAQPQPGADTAPAGAPAKADVNVLKVCADANNLPQSNDRGEGYENKLALALARDLKRRVEYTYFPQRQGFVRNTLRAQDETTHQYKCDVIMGVPKGYDQTATTRAYMHSTYAIVVPVSEAVRNFKAATDVLTLPAARSHSLRVGIFAQTPGSDWVLQNGLLDHAVLYAAQSGDPHVNPQSVVADDLVAAKIDAAVVWGPVAGFLVERHAAAKWMVLPFKPDPRIRFDYELSMGVRFGEQEWKDTLDGWIDSHRGEIERILLAYHIPLLDDQGEIRSIQN